MIMSLKKVFFKQKKNKKRPRIVSNNTFNNGVAVAGGCGEGAVSIDDKGFSLPGSSTATDFLSLLDRFFVFRLRRVGVETLESGRVWGRKSAVIAVGRK